MSCWNSSHTGEVPTVVFSEVSFVNISVIFSDIFFITFSLSIIYIYMQNRMYKYVHMSEIAYVYLEVYISAFILLIKFPECCCTPFSPCLRPSVYLVSRMLGASCSQFQFLWQFLPGGDHLATVVTMTVWRKLQIYG